VSKNARNVHWPIQTFAAVMFTAAWGLGVWLATTLKLWVTWNGHAIIGTVIFGLMLTMPVLGVLHRANYINTKTSYKWAWIHVYLGRVLILAGIINGGLGLQLSYSKVGYASIRSGQIGYGVGAGVIALFWIAISVFACIRSKGDVTPGGESGPKVTGPLPERNNSQETDVGDTGALEKEKYADEHVVGLHEHNGVVSDAVAPAAVTTTTTTTTTHAPHPTAANEQWVSAPAQVPATGDDIVHGGTHYNTRLANIIDPAT